MGPYSTTIITAIVTAIIIIIIFERNSRSVGKNPSISANQSRTYLSSSTKLQQ